jgi:hypothetical protein
MIRIGHAPAAAARRSRPASPACRRRRRAAPAAAACAASASAARRRSTAARSSSATFAGIVDIALQTLVVPVIDDRRVIRRGRHVREAFRHHGARRVDERPARGRPAPARSRARCRSAGVQQLADHDALGCVLQRVVGAEDGRRLAAQFQRHRRQVVRGHAHDAVADRGRAGEQQVVEGQPGEICADRGIAEHHR